MASRPPLVGTVASRWVAACRPLVGRGASRWVAAAVGYSVLAVAETWPLAARGSSVFPHDALDPALATWILWWNAHARPLSAAWWNAPMFWPLGGALALSESFLAVSILATPLQWLGCSAVVSYNIAFIASFPLAALACHALVYALVRRHDAAMLAAIIYAFGPYRVSQMAHLQMLWTFGAPLALFALHRHAQTRQARWLVVFAIAWCVTALSSGYVLLFFPVLLALWAAWHVRDLRQLAAIAIAGIAGSLPLLPLLLHYQRVQDALALSRGYGEISRFSADVGSIVAAAPDLRVWGRVLGPGGPEAQLFPGLTGLLLIVAGIAVAQRAGAGLRQPRAIRLARGLLLCVAVIEAAVAVSVIAIGPWSIPSDANAIVSASGPGKPLTIALAAAIVWLLTSPGVVMRRRRASAFTFYLLASAVMFLLALGPQPRLAGRVLLHRGLYWLLLQLPGFSAVRAPARFGVLLMLCLAVAAALAFARLAARLSRRARLAAVAAATALALVDGWPRVPMVAVPAPLSLSVPAGAAVLELPLGLVDRDSAALFHGMAHGRPVVNGYSGYEPLHYGVLRLALDARDEGVFTPLVHERDLLVAVDRAHTQWADLVARHPRSSPAGGNAQWIAYRVAASPPSPPSRGRVMQQPLAIRAIDASDHREATTGLLDGDPNTRWDSGRPQSGSEWIVVDFGSDVSIAGIRLEFGDLVAGYPRRLEIDCAADGSAWRVCWRGSTGALLLESALADATRPAIAVDFDTDLVVRRLRLRQIGSHPANSWIMADVAAFAPPPR